MINKNAQLRFARPGLTAALALGGLLFVSAMPAAAQAQAQDCGGVLSPTTGNVVGTVAGAAAGGLIGNQFGKGTGQGVMTGLGVVGGALAGGYVGRQVEGCGRTPAAAAPAASGNRAAPQPTVAGQGRSCRYVLTQTVIDGREQQMNGIACMAPDGSWQAASGPAAERAAETDLVFRAQQSLREQGFYTRAIDGKWGAGTSNAVRSFQQANGLVPSGSLDGATQQSLGIAPSAVMAQAVPPVQPVAAPAAIAPVPPIQPARATR